MHQEPLPAGNRSDDQKRFLPGPNRIRERSVRRFVGQVLLARKEAQERTPLSRHLIANRPAQHRITSLKRIKHRSLRDRAIDLKLDFVAGVRQRSQMLREYDPDHVSVCTSTDSTPGKSRTIGFQLSPASADA